MKPEFTREFNAAHAKAGAPYCCSNGEEATILKWDCRDPIYPIVGVMGEMDDSNEWQSNGLYNDGINTEYDLVMTPLGMIDGKPVFVGDSIVTDGGMPFDVNPAHAINSSFFLHGCKWPAPAKVYPETAMDHSAMFGIYGFFL